MMILDGVFSPSSTYLYSKSAKKIKEEDRKKANNPLQDGKKGEKGKSTQGLRTRNRRQRARQT